MGVLLTGECGYGRWFYTKNHQARKEGQCHEQVPWSQLKKEILGKMHLSALTSPGCCNENTVEWIEFAPWKDLSAMKQWVEPSRTKTFTSKAVSKSDKTEHKEKLLLKWRQDTMIEKSLRCAGHMQLLNLSVPQLSRVQWEWYLSTTRLL
jgi:hypothetical protein